jgi:hypothetical protein
MFQDLNLLVDWKLVEMGHVYTQNKRYSLDQLVRQNFPQGEIAGALAFLADADAYVYLVRSGD